MEYISHREEDRVQLLLQHLLGTAERARDFAEKFGKGEWGYCCGMLHDIGKYSDKFQRKIKEEIGRAHVELQSHSEISYAVFCLKKKKKKKCIKCIKIKIAEKIE